MRKVFLIAGLFSVAALAWGANDTPWKDKTYDQWDTKDVQKILADSPWARTVRVDVGWKPVPVTAANPPANPAANPGTNANGTPSATGGKPAMAGGGYGGANRGSSGAPSGGNGANQDASGSGGDDDNAQATTIFEVRWASSRIMREAFVRAAEINNTLKPADADAALARPVETYQVVVVGPDMTPFMGVDQNTLKGDATLVLKKSKKKLNPITVTIQKDGDKVKDVIFDFARRSDNGEPNIGPDEKNATFECKVNKLNLKAQFEVPKMADSKGSDL